MNNASTYNGWSNRETWLANLWLTNDDSTDTLYYAIKAGDDDYDSAVMLERFLRDQLDSELSSANLWSDLLTSAFDRVNWQEVVENNK